MAIATSGDGPIPGPEAVIIEPTILSEDGTTNLRKRRAIREEVGTPEPTVKVRKNGNGASQNAVQVCGGLSYFYQ